MARDLAREVDLFVARVGHWTGGRWRSRADGVHALVQRIADLAAGAEGEPRRPVPRLDNNLALTDQLRVVAADLIAAGPPPAVLEAAAADVASTRERVS